MSLGSYVDLLRPEFAAYRLPFVPLPLWAIWLAALLFGGPVELDLLRAVHGKARAAAHARKPSFLQVFFLGMAFLGPLQECCTQQAQSCVCTAPVGMLRRELCDLLAPFPRALGPFSALGSTEGCPAAAAAATGVRTCAQRGWARAGPASRNAPRKAAAPWPRRCLDRTCRGRQVPQFDCSKARRELGLDFIDVRRTAQARGPHAQAPARMRPTGAHAARGPWQARGCAALDTASAAQDGAAA